MFDKKDEKISEFLISKDVLKQAKIDESNLILSITLAIIIGLLWIIFV